MCLCGVVLAHGQEAENTYFFGQQQAKVSASRVPIRSEHIPASRQPVSLTTELQPGQAVTPLLPEGMDELPEEPVAIDDDNRRWTFSIEARTIYDDNIDLAGKGFERSDFVFLVSPSVTWRHGDSKLRRGSYAQVSYTPSASIFASNSSENSVDHTLRADVQKRFGKLAVGVDGKYQRLSGATPELSDRVDRDEAGARLRAGYELSSRTSLETSLGWSQVDYREGSLEDYDEWISETYAGYQFSGRTKVAAGAAFGQLDVSGRETQNYQRALVKVSTEASGKLTLDAKAGVEFRSTGAGDSTTPVFNLTAEYRPTGRTTLAAGVYREVTASGSVENENLTRTGGSVKVYQKLGSRLTAGVEAGYEQMEYDTTESGAVASGREDDYFYVRPSLKYEFRAGRRAEIYYSYREDDSNLSNFDFAANQAGLSVGFDF